VTHKTAEKSSESCLLLGFRGDCNSRRGHSACFTLFWPCKLVNKLRSPNNLQVFCQLASATIHPISFQLFLYLKSLKASTIVLLHLEFSMGGRTFLTRCTNTLIRTRCNNVSSCSMELVGWKDTNCTQVHSDSILVSFHSSIVMSLRLVP
jgi:hypothetical protein